MRRTFGSGLAVAVVALALGCGKSSPATGPAGTGLEGGWTLVKVETEGKVQDDAVAKMSAEEKSIRATGDKMITSVKGKEELKSYKLDPSKSPPEVDLSATNADGKAETMYGIYKLEGGTLTICAVASDSTADRPKEFKTVPGDKRVIMTLTKD